jgi:hypothetical protein
MNILTKAILLIIFAILVVLVYGALVVASRAEDIEQAYWQDRARQEGREHGNKKDSR